MSPPASPRFPNSPWLRLGLAGLVLGTGPLLVAVAIGRLMGDSNPNPVGFGILAMLTFWPSIILILIGVVTSLVGKICFSRS